MELKRNWVFDECSDEELLFDKLDEWQDYGLISYKASDGWVFNIKDLELTKEQVKEIVELFEELDVYPSDDDSDEEEDDWGWNNEDDWN